MASKSCNQNNKIFVSGYFRQLQVNLNILIPDPIIDMITAFCMVFSIYGMGNNLHAELALNHQHVTRRAERLTHIEDLISSVNDIHINYNAIFILKNESDLYAAGFNANQQLHLLPKLNSNSSVIKLTKINLFNQKIKFLSKTNGYPYHHFIMTQTNKLYVSGYNADGIFGDGKSHQTNSERVILQQVNTDFIVGKSNGEHIVNITCGERHSMFLTNLGNVYRCGSNRSRQTSDDGTMKKVLTPRRMDVDYKIIKMSAGCFHSLFIDEYNRLICCGDNHAKQCGVISGGRSVKVTINKYFNDNKIKIKDIATGYHFSLCLDFNGICYVFGDISLNQMDQVKKPTAINTYVSNIQNIKNVSCGYEHCILLSECNNIISLGSNDYNQCSTIINDKKIKMPHVWSKKGELDIEEYCYIERIIAMRKETIIIVHPFKKYKL